MAAPCLDFALVTKTTVGVWGNTTGKDRRRLRQEHTQTNPAREGNDR